MTAEKQMFLSYLVCVRRGKVFPYQRGYDLKHGNEAAKSQGSQPASPPSQKSQETDPQHPLCTSCHTARREWRDVSNVPCAFGEL